MSASFCEAWNSGENKMNIILIITKCNKQKNPETQQQTITISD